MANKGSPYERLICRQLSEWWSGGTDSDLFWRTSNSGGRATVRGRKKLATRGHYGDVAATDAVGAPLLDFLTLELKRGYSGRTIQDLLDSGPKGKQVYREWFEQARNSHKLAGSFSWAVIVRRDKRVSLIFLPESTVNRLRGCAAFRPMPTPFLSIHTVVSDEPTTVIGVTLSGFFSAVDPEELKMALAKG